MSMGAITVGMLLMCVLTQQALGGRIRVQGRDLMKDGHKVFLSGANTAWVAYGNDFGNSQYQYRRDQFLHRLDLVRQAGGNSMRTWVHIHGEQTPRFNSSGHVTGLDRDGTFLSDFRQYLDDAQARGILIFPTLWNGAAVHHPEYLRGLITDTSKLQTYIDNALIPWVRAVKDHPALGGWDIINEIEGFVIPGEHNSEPCFDTTILLRSGAGWAGHLFSARDLLKFINWQVDAIRRIDPSALVTAGSSGQTTQSDQWNDRNYYSDNCLITAGGKSGGTLTFYSTHSYAWEGRFADDAVFNHRSSDYQLDKPLVVAEFEVQEGVGWSAPRLFTYVYDHGYNGAWIWSDDTEEHQRAGIAALDGRNGAGGLVNFSL